MPAFGGRFLDLYSAAAAPSITDTLPADDTSAVKATLKQMVAIVRKYKADATTINAARMILTSAGIKDFRSQKSQGIAALQHWVRDNIVYVADPRGVELLQTPPRTLQLQTGDCDDKSILLAALLETVGCATRFMAVGGTGAEWSNDGDDWDAMGDPPYSHVLPQVRMGNSWLCLETIVASAEPGWCPPGIEIMMVAHI